VQRVATGMISISDNTAENMLIALLGRAAVQAAARASGMADPALDVPFLTTRELFVLKLHDWPKLAQRYLALGTAGRQALLSGTVDQVPDSTLSATGWTGPRDIGSIEWFASPADICRVFASLATLAGAPKLAPLVGILERNPGGMSLNPSRWRPVWFRAARSPACSRSTTWPRPAPARPTWPACSPRTLRRHSRARPFSRCSARSRGRSSSPRAGPSYSPATWGITWLPMISSGVTSHTLATAPMAALKPISARPPSWSTISPVFSPFSPGSKMK
jgi:hypothetical protein